MAIIFPLSAFPSRYERALKVKSHDAKKDCRIENGQPISAIQNNADVMSAATSFCPMIIFRTYSPPGPNNIHGHLPKRT